MGNYKRDADTRRLPSRGARADVTGQPARRLSRRRLLTSGAGLGTALIVPSLVGGAGRTVSATPAHQHGLSPDHAGHGGGVVSLAPGNPRR